MEQAMSGGREKVLLYGYGNPGRGDDGLGPALASAIELADLPGVEVDADYQLTIEDAARLAGYGAVVFVDAAAQGEEPFSFVLVDDAAAHHLGWTSHSVTPAQVVALARDLFGCRVPAYLLAIRGYQFTELCEVFSPSAKENLAAALAFAKRVLLEPGCCFARYLRSSGPTAAGPELGGSTWKA
jgi:hydrogenase maturation protease